MRRLLPVVLLLTSCVVPFRAVPPTGDEVTIFVPGYEGSFLASDEDPSRLAWVTPGQGLCGGEETLALPFEGEQPLASFGPLHAAGPLSRLVILPWILEGDIYGSWMEFGTEKLPGFIPFGYDWRQDIRITAIQLGALIERLEREHGGRLKVNLVSHSMGGLVALFYLRYGTDFTAHRLTWAGAQHVQRVVFVGTPFRGAPGILKDFLVGTPVGLNHALLSKEAIFSFPAAFQLLSATDDYFTGASGEPILVAASDPATWCERGWSVFEDPRRCASLEYQEHLGRMLRGHRETSRALGDVPGNAPGGLQALTIIGRGRETTAAARLVEGKVDVEHPVRADGDGTVLVTSASPTEPLAANQVVWTQAQHVALLNDGAIRQAIARFLGR